MIEEVPLEQLKIRENRIRVDIGDLSNLMRSMTDVGQLNPLTIDENYNILEGTRRYYSAKNLGWSKIKCEIRIGLSEYQKLIIEIDENLQRKNFNPAEEAKALALKKREYLKIHPEYRRGGDRKSDKYKKAKQNQNANFALGFAKNQAREIGASERTIITKTKIGEYILNKKLKAKTVDQFSKRKLSQRKVLEEIKAIEQGNKSKEEAIKSAKAQTQTVPTIKSEIIVELEDEEAKNCKDCKRGLHLRCPSCKGDFISCQHYKNPYLRRINSKACENYD
jgi:ParB family chromosome partitioning protein